MLAKLTRRVLSLTLLFLRAFVTNIGLVFIPIPIGPMRRMLVGYREKRDAGIDSVFFSHHNAILFMHLVWVGWLVGAVAFFNSTAQDYGWRTVTLQPFCWLWLIALLTTLTVQAYRFNKMTCLVLSLIVIASAVSGWVIQLQTDSETMVPHLESLQAIPLNMSWGLPVVVSFLLGLLLAGSVTFSNLNFFRIPANANFIEIHRFPNEVTSLNKGALSFRAVYPCLVRKVFFGLGDIEVALATGKTTQRISNVFCTEKVAEDLRQRRSRITAEMDRNADEYHQISHELGDISDAAANFEEDFTELEGIEQ